MIKLQSNVREFTNIVQVADIQIRLTKRHDEYREVFNRLFDEVKNTPKSTAVVIVGDIVHSKLDLSPECVQVTKEFLVGLANIRPTILVAGNHDTNLTNKNRLDSLSPIVEAINHKNLHYLKKSGLYSLGDICFNNYSVFDNDYIKGVDIPQIYKNEYRYFVCLFHGTVDGAVSEMGFKLVNKSVPLSMFDNHDIVLLGDIHKMQDLQTYENNSPAIHYCGSLIQQNHGEELENHGYSFWNLSTRSYEHVDVSNDYGYFTVKIDKGQIITDLKNIPSKARVRLSCYESLPTETKAVIKELKKITILVDPPTYTREVTKESLDRSATLGQNLVHGDLKNRDHQIKLISDFLRNKLRVVDEDLINSVIKINDESNETFKTDDIAKNIKWSLIRFEWDNLFSFGEENAIDFTKVKDVVGLFASNASGKSSVFSALSWCIFDKCEREFKANNIINDQKMSCRALLEVDIGGIRYFIERTGKMDKKGAVKVNVRFWRNIDGKEEELTGIERSDTNNSIRAHMGNYEDFLLTSLSVQKSGKYETSFIDLGDSGRKDLLAQFMGLNIFDKLHEVANKRLNEITSVLKVYKNENFEEALSVQTDMLSQITSTLNEERKKESELSSKIDGIQKSILEESAHYIKIEGITNHSSQTLEQSKITCTNKIQSIFDDMANLAEEANITTKSIKKIDDDIGIYESCNISEKYSKWKDVKNSINEVDKKLSLKIVEVRVQKEISKKSDGHKFDPNCTFCVQNAGNIELESVDAKKKLAEYETEVKSILTEKANLSLVLRDIGDAETGYNEYNSFIKKKGQLQSSYLSLQQNLEKLTKKLNESKEDLTKINQEIEVLVKNREAVENNKNVDVIVDNLNKDLSNTKQIHKKSVELMQTLVGKVLTIESKIKEFTDKISKVKSIEKLHKAYDLYVQSVCRDGIPYEVICVAVPHIENEVNTILSQTVDFHAKFDVDGKNIVPFIVYDERRWLMSLGSGMEQFILSTAIRVALTNLSNLPKMNGLVIDEGFGVLDPEHLSTISNLFQYLKSNFDFIIIISHLDVMRDLVDNHVEIKKEAGFSKVNFI